MGSVISEPAVTMNIISADIDVSNTPQKVLVVGQGLAAGTYTSGELNTNIGNGTTDIQNLCGQGSMAAEMLIRSREINTSVQYDAIVIDDDLDDQTKRQVTITFAGTAGTDGTATVVVGSEKNYSFTIAIAENDTATLMGDAFEALVNANDDVPFVATNVAGVVTLVARNFGGFANSIGFSTGVSSSLVGDITVSYAQTVAGANNPGIDNILDVIGEERYQTIIWPYSDTTAEISNVSDFLDARFNVNNKLLDGIAITSSIDTQSNLVITGDVYNSQSLMIIGDELQTDADRTGGAILELPYVITSYVGAIRSLRLEQGTNISQYTISRNGALDSIGGPAIASKPYFNTPISQLPVIDTVRGFSSDEIQDLSDAGVSVLGNNRTATGIIMGEMLTTYKTDTAGNPDISFTFANYVDTASNIREYYFNNAKSRFAQSRLTEGDLVAGRDMANAELIQAVFTGWYDTLSGQDFVLTQAGEDSLQFFKENFSVDIDLDTGTATVTTKNALVTQLRNIFATMQIAFSTSG